MLRLWLTRRWLLTTLVAVLFGVACWTLGSWQWSRHVEQRTKVTAIEENYEAPPVPLTAVLDRLGAGGLAPEEQWTRVTLQGSYLPGSDLMVRNRTRDQTVGFEVLTPFVTERVTILVDRGWVPNAREAEQTPAADPAPTGPVEVVGWLRTGEPDLGRDLPAPQLASISVDDARASVPQLGDLDAYVVLGTQSPSTPAGDHPVSPLPRPDEGLGPHQAYAIQWWLTMPAGLVFVVFAIRRQVIQSAGDREGAGAAKPKKVRIWDEEDA
ncbi:SURF1 family protein [Intrasporangium sp.]|uniref:SURF1 family cytochrome oxidase biogenesis protein n=1 Tax=Intrasporangium sp. TaxID=1925024 RepID=UPI00293AF2EF|nr:SURF1 family protein [Intrasporangium sp.]MDV3220082.1 SURF1 family protein [Intrasporangium sp.]